MHFILIIAIFIISLLSTRLLISVFNKFYILDVPNDRSSHVSPTPRGGGIAILFSLGIYICATKYYNIESIFKPNIIYAIILLSVISFIDDIKSVSILIRLFFQCFAVFIALASLPTDQLLLRGYAPIELDRFLSFIGLVGCINAFNFMDGIDGITGAETIHILLSIIILSLSHNIIDQTYILDFTALIAAIFGFLIWNWSPAKIFIGDIGSIVLGFIIGWILLNIANNGYLITAVIISSYYIADSGITLFSRLIKGKNIFQPHSEHFFQASVKNGISHQTIVTKIIIANLCLLLTSFLSLYYRIFSLLIMALILCILLKILKNNDQN